MKGSKKKPSPARLEAEALEALVKRKEEYEKYFGRPNAQPDPKAEQAFTGIIKLIVELARDSAARKGAGRRTVEEILETEYGIKK